MTKSDIQSANRAESHTKCRTMTSTNLGPTGILCIRRPASSPWFPWLLHLDSPVRRMFLLLEKPEVKPQQHQPRLDALQLLRQVHLFVFTIVHGQSWSSTSPQTQIRPTKSIPTKFSFAIKSPLANSQTMSPQWRRSWRPLQTPVARFTGSSLWESKHHLQNVSVIMGKTCRK